LSVCKKNQLSNRRQTETKKRGFFKFVQKVTRANMKMTYDQTALTPTRNDAPKIAAFVQGFYAVETF
jgi:hypothetical protein